LDQRTFIVVVFKRYLNTTALRFDRIGPVPAVVVVSGVRRGPAVSEPVEAQARLLCQRLFLASAARPVE
jgi:hypothetical protein